MRKGEKTQFYFLILLLLAHPARCFCGPLQNAPSDHGPEVSAFLSLTKDEEEELEFQIRRNEITRRDYVRSKRRLAIHRQVVLDIVKKSGEDVVPELHVVAASEVDQLIENGTRALKGAKPGAVLNEKWKLVAEVTRGELFYVFERITK
ncbi:MAG TPA: hypothetical protein VKC34_00985 [Blastocatellia bacterium]|nr:hypothetical protein [Blastocatellia bacterium]